MSYDWLKFTDSRWSKLSDISADIAQIFFASVFLGPLFLDKTNWLVVALGLIVSIGLWGFSLFLTKETAL